MAHELTGHVIDAEFAEVGEVKELRDEVEKLQSENRKLRTDLIKARADSESAVMAITALRNQLGPLHRALRAVFGEIEAVVPADAPSEAYSRGSSTGNDPIANMDKWDAVKRRLGGKDAECIEILLTTGPKTNSQLAPLLKMHYSNAANVTKRLNSLGFIEKQGDSWALKV